MAIPRGPGPSLRGRALMWLAQREHSRLELGQKLLRWARLATPSSPDGQAEEPPDQAAMVTAIDALLDALQADGHLSDERFVESRVNARIARFGNRRIEQELRRYGADLTAPVRAQLQLSEAERARRVWAVKFGSPAPDASARARQMRFLAARGFTSDVIRHVVAGDDNEDCTRDR